jgi:hypothetical protein
VSAIVRVIDREGTELILKPCAGFGGI